MHSEIFGCSAQDIVILQIRTYSFSQRIKRQLSLQYWTHHYSCSEGQVGQEDDAGLEAIPHNLTDSQEQNHPLYLLNDQVTVVPDNMFNSNKTLLGVSDPNSELSRPAIRCSVYYALIIMLAFMCSAFSLLQVNEF